jgi:hypothetical protein
MTDKWFGKDMGTVVSVAEYGIDEGELVTAVDVLRFFEKPRNYRDLFVAYDEHLCVQGELQDERRATL